MGYTLDFFQDVGDGDHDTGDGVPAQHSHHGNYGNNVSVLQWMYETMGALYCSGVQKGCTAMAYRAPMIETGIVEPNIDIKTDENCTRRPSVRIPDDGYNIPCYHSAFSTCWQLRMDISRTTTHAMGDAPASNVPKKFKTTVVRCSVCVQRREWGRRTCDACDGPWIVSFKDPL